MRSPYLSNRILYSDFNRTCLRSSPKSSPVVTIFYKSSLYFGFSLKFSKCCPKSFTVLLRIPIAFYFRASSCFYFGYCSDIIISGNFFVSFFEAGCSKLLKSISYVFIVLFKFPKIDPF